jgi:type IV fimbrial biogenesis protein FimT
MGAGHRATVAAAAARSGVRMASGFTLLELMVAVAVASILVTVALPSFKHLALSNKLSTAANDLVYALTVARTEAVKTNATVQFCSNDATTNTTDKLGKECGTQTGAVFVLINNSPTPVLAQSTAISGSLKLNGTMEALRFTGQGLARSLSSTAPFSGQVADICTDKISTDNHRIISIAAGGSIVSTQTTTGSCP